MKKKSKKIMYWTFGIIGVILFLSILIYSASTTTKESFFIDGNLYNILYDYKVEGYDDNNNLIFTSPLTSGEFVFKSENLNYDTSCGMGTKLLGEVSTELVNGQQIVTDNRVSVNAGVYRSPERGSKCWTAKANINGQDVTFYYGEEKEIMPGIKVKFIGDGTAKSYKPCRTCQETFGVAPESFTNHFYFYLDMNKIDLSVSNDVYIRWTQKYNEGVTIKNNFNTGFDGGLETMFWSDLLRRLPTSNVINNAIPTGEKKYLVQVPTEYRTDLGTETQVYSLFLRFQPGNQVLRGIKEIEKKYHTVPLIDEGCFSDNECDTVNGEGCYWGGCYPKSNLCQEIKFTDTLQQGNKFIMNYDENGCLISRTQVPIDSDVGDARENIGIFERIWNWIKSIFGKI